MSVIQTMLENQWPALQCIVIIIRIISLIRNNTHALVYGCTGGLSNEKVRMRIIKYYARGFFRGFQYASHRANLVDLHYRRMITPPRRPPPRRPPPRRASPRHHASPCEPPRHKGSFGFFCRKCIAAGTCMGMASAPALLACTDNRCHTARTPPRHRRGSPSSSAASLAHSGQDGKGDTKIHSRRWTNIHIPVYHSSTKFSTGAINGDFWRL
eukprot:SAG11_NODE_3622_length_2332_cov_2.101657_1_plen_212_part_00